MESWERTAQRNAWLKEKAEAVAQEKIMNGWRLESIVQASTGSCYLDFNCIENKPVVKISSMDNFGAIRKAYQKSGKIFGDGCNAVSVQFKKAGYNSVASFSIDCFRSSWRVRVSDHSPSFSTDSDEFVTV